MVKLLIIEKIKSFASYCDENFHQKKKFDDHQFLDHQFLDHRISILSLSLHALLGKI